MIKDHYFKICILILGIIFLVIYYFNTQNGHYQRGLEDRNSILDTRTGVYYVFDGETVMSLDPRTGKYIYDGKVMYPTKRQVDPSVPSAPDAAPSE